MHCVSKQIVKGCILRDCIHDAADAAEFCPLSQRMLCWPAGRTTIQLGGGVCS
jgi:hypothetical protein